MKLLNSEMGKFALFKNRIGYGVAYCDNSNVRACDYDPLGNYVRKRPH